MIAQNFYPIKLELSRLIIAKYGSFKQFMLETDYESTHANLSRMLSPSESTTLGKLIWLADCVDMEIVLKPKNEK